MPLLREICQKRTDHHKIELKILDNIIKPADKGAAIALMDTKDYN